MDFYYQLFKDIEVFVCFFSVNKATYEMRDFLVRNKINPIKNFLVPFAQVSYQRVSATFLTISTSPPISTTSP